MQQQLQRGSPHCQEKQEVVLRNLHGLHAAAYHPKEEDRNILQKAPFGFGGFSGIFRTALVCIIW
jgi:hypothetical protein